MIAVDTNVFIGAIQTFDADLRIAARNAVKSLSKQGEELLCFPQKLVEFWNGATRPANSNGLGFGRGSSWRRRCLQYFPEDAGGCGSHLIHELLKPACRARHEGQSRRGRQDLQ